MPDNSPLAHSRYCKAPAPVLRLSWAGTPEQWCRNCGAVTPLPAPKENHR